MAPLKHSPRAVAPGADAGALVALISRRTGRPLEVAPLGGHPHALCESRGATALCEGVAANSLPATALFQLERKAGGAVGFRALGAGGNMLQVREHGAVGARQRAAGARAHARRGAR